MSSPVTAVAAPAARGSVRSSSIAPFSPLTPPALGAASALSSPASVAASAAAADECTARQSSLPSFSSLPPCATPSSSPRATEEREEAVKPLWLSDVNCAGLTITLKTEEPTRPAADGKSNSSVSRASADGGDQSVSAEGADDCMEETMEETASPVSPLSPSSTSAASGPEPQAPASSRRLPWTQPELTALVAGVAEHGKDWAAIMRDERYGPALSKRTVVACRKQFMFGRAMTQFRKQRQQQARRQQDADAEAEEEEGELDVEEEEEDQEEEEEWRPHQQKTHHTRTWQAARQHGRMTRHEVQEKEAEDDEVMQDAEVEDECDDGQQDSSLNDEELSDASGREGGGAVSGGQPWSNIADNELPPGKRKCEYRRCRHVCGCKSRGSDSLSQAVLNKHGRRSHEKAHSSHPHCSKAEPCWKLFFALKSGEGRVDAQWKGAAGAEDDEDDEDDGDEDEDDNDKEEEEDEQEAAAAGSSEEQLQRHEKDEDKEAEADVDMGGQRVFLAPRMSEFSPLPHRLLAEPILPGPPLFPSYRRVSLSPPPPSAQQPTPTAAAAPPSARVNTAVQSLLHLAPSLSPPAACRKRTHAWELDELRERVERGRGEVEAMNATMAYMQRERQQKEAEWKQQRDAWKRERAQLDRRIAELESRLSRADSSMRDRRRGEEGQDSKQEEDRQDEMQEHKPIMTFIAPLQPSPLPHSAPLLPVRPLGPLPASLQQPLSSSAFFRHSQANSAFSPVQEGSGGSGGSGGSDSISAASHTAGSSASFSPASQAEAAPAFRASYARGGYAAAVPLYLPFPLPRSFFPPPHLAQQQQPFAVPYGFRPLPTATPQRGVCSTAFAAAAASSRPVLAVCPAAIPSASSAVCATPTGQLSAAASSASAPAMAVPVVEAQPSAATAVLNGRMTEAEIRAEEAKRKQRIKQ